jgi:hypothetical protein
LLKTENPVYCSEADCLILIKESGWEPSCVKEGILALLKSESLIKRALLKSESLIKRALLKSESLIKRGRNYWALLKSQD